MNRILLLVCLLFIISSCQKEEDGTQLEKLVLVRQHELPVPEPSGLAFSANRNALYAVSDQNGKVYKLSLTGSLLKTLDFVGNDLEGITVDPYTGQIWVAEERSRNVVQLNAAGSVINRFHLNIEQHGENSGLEGIAFNTATKHLYVLNENSPKLLLEIDKNGNLLKETLLSFASDLSGIFYDDTEEILWIVSDESKTVNQCKLSGELIKSYRIPVSNAEGIAIDAQAKEVYVLSDNNEKLYVFGY